MATIRAYTTIEQSRKLADILPFESADMCWFVPADEEDYATKIEFVAGSAVHYAYEKITDWNDTPYIPAWSCAALLDILESEIDGEEGETYQLNIEKDGTWWNIWYREQYDEANPIETESTEELIDACYNMIIKLHEMNLL